MVKKLDIVTVKTCKDPGTPRNGRRNGTLQVGETLHFSCAHCYQLKGSSTRTCLSDLTWSGRQPVCTGKFCRRLSVSLEFDWFQGRMNLLKIGGGRGGYDSHEAPSMGRNLQTLGRRKL